MDLVYFPQDHQAVVLLVIVSSCVVVLQQGVVQVGEAQMEWGVPLPALDAVLDLNYGNISASGASSALPGSG